jgi:hypothetical protein
MILINPYSIQPNEDWEIQEIETKTKELRTQPCELFLYLVNRLMANFCSKVEIEVKSQPNVSYDLVLFGDLISEINHREIHLYPRVNDFIYYELKKVIDVIVDIYAVNDLKSTKIKDRDDFLSITPFFYSLSDWRSLMMNIQSTEYSRCENEFVNKVEFLITSSLEKTKLNELMEFTSQTKITGIWNFQLEKYYLLSKEAFDFLSEEDDLDFIVAIGKYTREEIKSFEIIKNKEDLRDFNSLSIYFSVLCNLNSKFGFKKNPIHLFTFLKEILQVKTEKELVQIKKFINNFFIWNTEKYGEIQNTGQSISFLNRKTVKYLVGFLWYVVCNSKLTTQKKAVTSQYFANLIIEELKDLNKEKIGLSSGNLRKNLTHYADLFKSDFPSSTRTTYKLFQ